MSNDFVGDVDRLMNEKHHVVEDSVGLLPHQLSALRALVLEISLLLPEERQMEWLLTESTFRHVDQDLLDLHEGRIPRSYLGDSQESPAEQLRNDILSMLSQVLSLAHE